MSCLAASDWLAAQAVLVRRLRLGFLLGEVSLARGRLTENQRRQLVILPMLIGQAVGKKCVG